MSDESQGVLEAMRAKRVTSRATKLAAALGLSTVLVACEMIEEPQPAYGAPVPEEDMSDNNAGADMAPDMPLVEPAYGAPAPGE